MKCFGEEKAYYTKKEKTPFYNISQLLQENGFSDYCAEGITSFFSFRYPILEHTMFKDIEKGDYSISDGRFIEQWKPDFLQREVIDGRYIQNSERLILSAIEEMVRDKKRVGVMLSGGLDSSLVLAMLKRVRPNIEIFTYSLGFYDEDEFEHSRFIASFFSDKHWEYVVRMDDYFGPESIMCDLILLKGAPLHPNELPLALAEKQAKADGCEIVLCGEGADDIFGGYGQNMRMYLQYQDNEDYSTFLLDRYRYFSKDEMRRLIQPKYLCDDVQMVRRVLEEKECPGDIRNKMLYFIQRIHTRGLIERGANALKFNGFQEGFPFTNPCLVTYANSIAFRCKVMWKGELSDKDFQGANYKEISEVYDIPKYILKKIAETYLPKKIIYRRKHSFPVPFETWLSNYTTYDFDNKVFASNDISYLSGWKKFMAINLDLFIKCFRRYQRLNNQPCK